MMGCTTTQRMSIRDENTPLNHKIGAVYFLWQPSPSFDIRITRVVQGYKPTITDTDKAKAQEGVRQLIAAIGSESVYELSSKLKQHGQTVMPTAHGAKTLIRIVPVKGLTECNGLGCTHDLAIEVIVTDIALRKEIWKGGFKVGLSALDQFAGNKVDHRVVESFVDSIISALKRENFI